MFSKSRDKRSNEAQAAIAFARDLPPPERMQKRRLSLRLAIATATQRDREEFVSLRHSPVVESSTVSLDEHKAMEARLLDLRAEILVQEDQIAQREERLRSREMELAEREALIEAHNKLIASEARTNKADVKIEPDHSDQIDALNLLKSELAAQEATLQEVRKTLQDRESYIEECENQLVQKSMSLTEREAQIEQDEEDIAAYMDRVS